MASTATQIGRSVVYRVGVIGVPERSFMMHTSPLPAARGEVEEAKRPRVRCPLRESERCRAGGGVADISRSPRPAKRPPHPDPLPAQRGEGDAAQRPAPTSQRQESNQSTSSSLPSIRESDAGRLAPPLQE